MDSAHPAASYVLKLPGEEPFVLRVPVPRTDGTVLYVLPAMRAVADLVFARSAEAVAAMGRPITCGPGCGVCCNQLVGVSAYEALAMARLAESIEGETGERVRAGFARAVEAMEAAGLLARVLEVYSAKLTDKQAVLETQAAYFKLGVPCPFLDLEGSCLIHPYRPIICRQYSVTSPPVNCARVYEGAAIQKVLHPVDLAGAASAFDGAGPTPTRAWPLSLALLLKPKLARTKWPTLPLPSILARFLNYAGSYYADMEV